MEYLLGWSHHTRDTFWPTEKQKHSDIVVFMLLSTPNNLDYFLISPSMPQTWWSGTMCAIVC